MEKKYKNLPELVKNFGLREAFSYKFLELRDKSPLVNKMLSSFIIGHLDCSAYSSSYIAHWDFQGKLTYFNPNPDYPKDFRPIDKKTNLPIKELTEKEFQALLPIEFAKTMVEMFGN